MKLLEPTIVSDGGPWAHHDMPCCVYRDQPATLDLSSGIFLPGASARDDGWMLIKPPWWLRPILRRYEPGN
jgi:hypothetical protein